MKYLWDEMPIVASHVGSNGTDVEVQRYLDRMASDGWRLRDIVQMKSRRDAGTMTCEFFRVYAIWERE